jgi:quercetin 2,3-dioxygenase
MINIRRSSERGHNNFGWLDTRYTFSFNDYYDTEFMGFRDLRVINEDFIEPKRGFPKHGHRDMEIITYMISGDLSHEDSMGNASTIRPNEIQRMTAGTGIMHSEYSSEKDKTHLLQIWILPNERNLKPGYEQKLIAADEKRGKLKLVASGAKNESGIFLNQDVFIYASILAEGEEISYDLPEGRYAWMQIVKGSLELNGEILNQGDGAAISEERLLKIKSLENDSEFLLFDLR